MQSFIRLFIFSLLLLFFFSQVSANEANEARARKLLEKLNGLPEDTAKINTYNALATLYTYRDYKKAMEYAKEAERLSLKMDYQKGLGDSYCLQATTYGEMEDFSNALRYANKTLALDKKRNLTGNLGADYTLLGSIYSDQSDFSKSLGFYIEALKTHEKYKEEDQLAKSYSNIANVFYYNAQYKTALIYYNTALTYLKKFPNSNDEGMLLHNMGLVYSDMGEVEKARNNFTGALRIAEKYDYINLLKLVYNSLASTYYVEQQWDTCLFYVNKSKAIYEQLKDSANIMELNTNIASVYVDMKEYKKALDLYNTSLKYSKKDVRFLSMIYSDIAKLYELMKDFENAYKYQKLYMAARDSVFSGKNTEQIAELQTRFETNKKEQQNKLLQQENKVKQGEINKQKTTRNYIALIGILVCGFSVWIFGQYRNKQKANALLAIQNTEIQEQKQVIEEKNKDVTDSIRYAQRIQEALLPKEEQLKKYFPEHFVLYAPKDIVSGDFYWLEAISGSGSGDSNCVLFAAVDCTGHGVPGAMVSVVGHNALNRSVREFGLTSPASILNKLNDLVEETFEKSADEMKDGMDISLGSLDPSSHMLDWAGANNGLWIVREKKGGSASDFELTELKADKQPIGKFENRRSFTNHRVQLQKGDHIYLFTDGFADQFGGGKGKKFKYKQLKELLLASQHLAMEEQKNLLERTIVEWRGSLEQVDDILIIGIKV